jgi:hypothetical protein
MAGKSARDAMPQAFGSEAPSMTGPVNREYLKGDLTGCTVTFINNGNVCAVTS